MTEATDKYQHLAASGEVTVNLGQEEACAVLFANDYGVDNLSIEDQRALDWVIYKLKYQIWP